MNLYLISQDIVASHDTFDSAVVAAVSTNAAKEIHPASIWDGPSPKDWSRPSGCWAFNPSDVKSELIGKARKGTEAGVICASFNAG